VTSSRTELLKIESRGERSPIMSEGVEYAGSETSSEGQPLVSRSAHNCVSAAGAPKEPAYRETVKTLQPVCRSPCALPACDIQARQQRRLPARVCEDPAAHLALIPFAVQHVSGARNDLAIAQNTVDARSPTCCSFRDCVLQKDLVELSRRTCHVDWSTGTKNSPLGILAYNFYSALARKLPAIQLRFESKIIQHVR
jgi:hypothetical protein